MNKSKVCSSSQINTTLLTDLSFDIIINILNRLPVESLFNFLRVCKSWHALLSIPKISMHLNLLSTKKYILKSNVTERSSSRQVCRKLKIPIDLYYPDYMLLNPVNGILCICGPLLSNVSYVYLWNPLTREFKALPKPNVTMGYVAVSFGFGFVPKNNDFKVVRILQNESKPDSRIEIYSLNRNSWKSVERDVSVNRSISRTFSMYRSYACSGNFCDGGLRWFAVSKGENTCWYISVVMIDLETEVITEVCCNSVCDISYGFGDSVNRLVTRLNHRDGLRSSNSRVHVERGYWSLYETDAMLLTYPEEDLVLCQYPDDSQRRYSWNRDTIRMTFAASLVSLNRSHDDNPG